MNYKRFEQNLILWEPFIVMSERTFAEPTHLASVNAQERNSRTLAAILLGTLAR